MSPLGRPPVFVLLFFSIFGFVGIAVMAFLWGDGDGFGSLITLGFVVMGFGVPLSLLRKRKAGSEMLADMIRKQQLPTRLTCPGCGANLGIAEVSPGGDAKCSYCKGWFNIYRN